MIEFGGHAQAAGFSVRTDNLDALAERLVAGCAGQADLTQEPVVADYLLAEEELTWSLHRGLNALRPFGQSNAQPIFLSERLRVIEARPVGVGGKHLRLRLRVGRQTLTGFGPNLGNMAAALSAAGSTDALYALESSTWNGNDSLELRLQDVRPRAVSVN